MSSPRPAAAKAKGATSNSTICIVPRPPAGLIPLGVAARDVGRSRAGLRLLLIRTGKAIRFDGRLYVEPETLDAIRSAYVVLGMRTHA